MPIDDRPIAVRRTVHFPFLSLDLSFLAAFFLDAGVSSSVGDIEAVLLLDGLSSPVVEEEVDEDEAASEGVTLFPLLAA